MSLRPVAVLGLALLASAHTVHAQKPVACPLEVSDSAVAAGRRIFEGTRNCMAHPRSHAWRYAKDPAGMRV